MDLIVLLSGEGSLHRQVYGALRATILGGRLHPGDRLPATRSLAGDLGVSRATIVSAYEQLGAEGYTIGRRGAGTFVAAELPHGGPTQSAPRPRPLARTTPRLSSWAQRVPERLPRWRTEVAPPRFDFQYGRPALSAFPHDVWRRIQARRARDARADDFDYPPPQGLEVLRRVLCDYLARARAVRATPDQIVITTGSQQALDLVARVLLEPGDPVILEEPHYAGARIALASAGADLVPGPVDGQGLNPDAIDARDRARARLAYVTPSHQFPTGAVLPLARRLELLRWAETNVAWIVEDDYDSEFRYGGEPHPALQGLDDSGHVIYAGTFSKVLFPALRLGYLVLPPSLVGVFRRAKAVCDGGSSPMEQGVLADFLAGGHFERHLRRSRKVGAERRSALIRALRATFEDGTHISGEDAGLHLLVWPKGLSARGADEVVRRAVERGVAVQSARAFYLSPPRSGGLLVGYAAISAAQIPAGIATLAATVAEVR